MYCYLLGSAYGGTATEYFYTVGGAAVQRLLKALNIPDLEALAHAAESFGSKEWRMLHSRISERQTDSYNWSETDWSE